MLGEEESDLRFRYSYLHEVFDRRGENLCELLQAQGYNWVCYLDSYPEDAVCYRYVGEDTIANMECVVDNTGTWGVAE